MQFLETQSTNVLLLLEVGANGVNGKCAQKPAELYTTLAEPELVTTLLQNMVVLIVMLTDHLMLKKCHAQFMVAGENGVTGKRALHLVMEELK